MNEEDKAARKAAKAARKAAKAAKAAEGAAAQQEEPKQKGKRSAEASAADEKAAKAARKAAKAARKRAAAVDDEAAAPAPTTKKKRRKGDAKADGGGPALGPAPVRPLPPHSRVLAPMVGGSELAFRLLCRRHGADLAYTPMMYSGRFATDAAYREAELQTCAADAPLVAHFCGNEPETLLAAARLAAPHCCAIDLNLGCPQRIAHSGTRRSRELPPLISDQRTGTAAGTGTGGGMGHPRLYPLLTPSAIASAQATLDRTCSARRTAPSCSAS